MKRKLALAATCAAALASIATSQIEPVWEISAEAGGPALALSTSGVITHTISVTASSAGTLDGVKGRVVANADGCLEGSATGPVTLRVTIYNQYGDGTAAARALPACPETVSLEVSAPLFFTCNEDEVPCVRAATAHFEREGGDGGVATVQWNATGWVSGYGENPPDGASASVSIE